MRELVLAVVAFYGAAGGHQRQRSGVP